MRNRKKSILKIFLIMLFTLSYLAGHAQGVRRVFELKPQATYQKQIILKSSGFVQRGIQKLDISSDSEVTKTYVVNSNSEKGMEFTITIQKMDDVVDALGKRLHYNSEKGPDPTSRIETALHYMVGKQVKLTTDKHGTILSSSDPLAELANDSLLSFAGIQPEPFVKGTLFGLVGDFTYTPSLIKGYTWVDSAATDAYKMITNYEILSVSPAKTIIKFRSAVYGKLINSNSNGTFVIDNNTGVIVEKLVYSIATGYQVLNKKLYATSRSTSLSETVTQLE